MADKTDTTMKSKLRILMLATLISMNVGCKMQTPKSLPNATTFQSALDSQINDNMPGILVTVISRDKNIEWSGASGYSDKMNKTKLLPHQTFRIASVTKTFTATTILRLWEDGKFKLEDPVAMYISNEHSDILKRGGYNPQEITVFHLLTHSSGLSEHTHSDKYQLPYLKSNHVWTRTEQLFELIAITKPVGKPGNQFSYSDTGYILLGEIIENLTGKSLGEAIEDQLNLKKSGLKSIHIEDEGGEFDNERIHQYSENEDTYIINPTFDLYGGGGLLSSTHDLCLFYQYLFENKVFRNKSTLEKMLAPLSYPTKPLLDYRMGIWETEIEGMKIYTHSGFWGTQVVYIPTIKTSIAVNYSQRWNNKGVAPIIPILIRQLLENNPDQTIR